MKIVIPERYRDLFDEDIMEFEEILDVIEELNNEITHLQEEFDRFKKNVEENYKFIPTEEQIGYDRKNW